MIKRNGKFFNWRLTCFTDKAHPTVRVWLYKMTETEAKYYVLGYLNGRCDVSSWSIEQMKQLSLSKEEE